MNAEYRIYYESYEQAIHFLAPALLAIDQNATFDFVSISKIGTNSIIAAHLAPGLSIKNPDALFSKIMPNGVEVGFAWIEVSTAVDTQDHDLQRFDSIIAAAAANIPFIKVWARRISNSSHGGQTNYDLEQSLKLAWQGLNSVAIEVEWPILQNKTRAIRNPKYMSCPNGTITLPDVLDVALNGLNKFGDPNYFFHNPLSIKYTWIQRKITSYNLPLPTFSPSNSTRLFSQNNRWHLKFNRWSHAMDPERGMAYFYSIRLHQRLVGLLHDPTALTAKDAALNFKAATGIDVSHLTTAGPHNIDPLILSSVINRNGRSIVYNCDRFKVCDTAGNTLITFEWTLTAQKIPLPNINTNISTSLIPLTKTSEDDVTYAAACHFYPINGFKVHSVSYPGAQGDFALLEGSGRSVLRTYIDVIALKSINSTEIVSLTESKGSRAAGPISKDADKVSEWKSNPSKKAILLNALGQSNSAVIYTSVAFPGDNMMQFNNAQKVDFAITVSNSEWVIWPRGGQRLQGINVMQGNLNIRPKWSY